MTEQHSFCRICAAACGIVVETNGQQVARIRGDKDHPISRGYTCEKGRALPEWHHGPHRLDRPRLNGQDHDWNAVLDDLAGTIARVTEDSSADAIGVYLATGLAYDSIGQVATALWMGALGSSSFYSAATVDNAPVLVAAEEVAGHPMLNPVWEPHESQLLLLVGTNPVISHGYGTTLADPVSRLREHQSNGGTIWTIDPRRTQTAALSDVHLSNRPGSDVILLAAIVAELLKTQRCRRALESSCRGDDIVKLTEAVAPFTIEAAALATGCERSLIERLIAEFENAHGRVAMFCGTGTTMAVDGVLVEWLRWVLLIMTDSVDVRGGMRFNRGIVNRLAPVKRSSRVAPGPQSRLDLSRVAGQMPVAAMVDEIEAGRLRVLVITGGNPLSAFPEPERFRHAASLLDALVVVDVSESELTELATHVLPATGQLERADLTLAEHVSFRPGTQFTSAIVPPVHERQPVWWILAGLAERLGRPMFGGAPLDVLSDELLLTGFLEPSPLDPQVVFSAGPHGVDVPKEFGWVRPLMTPDGFWSLAPEIFLQRLAVHQGPELGLVLVPRRESAWSNSVRFAGIGDEPIVLLNPEDASVRNLQDGEWIAVVSAHGSLVATLKRDASIRSGVVSITHGHPGSLTGTLTSSRVGVDQLTAMPTASGLPVRIERLST